MPKLVECIPNFSEGRRLEVIEAIVKEIESVPQVRMLDREMDKDHNRAVLTFLGEPEAVKKAAFLACAKATELIDMNKHTGEHPRIGATDVIPFVPISGVTMDDCVKLSRELGKEIAEKLKIPVYLYEKSATCPERENLAKLREGQYEGLKIEIEKNPDKTPDFGKPKFHPTAGATVVGARDPLVAFNVNLGTSNLDLARTIAKRVRFRDGGLRFIKANGFALRERGIVQVSMNLVNYQGTPIFSAFEMVKREAERYGIPVVGCEIVGLVPLNAMLDVADYYLRLENFKYEQILENKLWGGGATETIPTLFLEKVASKEPTPGGGSVSALAGALAGALTSMVCRLTIGRKKYAEVSSEMKEVLKKSENLRQALTNLIEEDAEAFDKVMMALKLPKETPAEKKIQEAKLEEAYQRAAKVPLEVMKQGLEILDLSKIVAQKGNINSVSDAGVAALMAFAGIEGAGLNVQINLPSIQDEQFKREAKQQMELLWKKAKELAEEVKRIVQGKIS
ncbi:MAG: glutamate formimidoyltransferase [Candidatus Edwardsbacteria bacterium]